MQDTMKAIRKCAPGPGLEICEVPVPQVGPQDVLVQVEAASICGTDVHIYRWDPWSQQRIRPPLTIGHEFAGTVVARGENVEFVREGDYVSAESHITCGMCYQCRTGQAHMCPKTKILGIDCEGTFAEYVCLPEKIIWKNDRSKLPPEVATLQEPFGNAVYATLAHDLAGQSVAVLGCGPMGLFSIAIAKASGAASIFAADLNPYRLQLARRMGADDVFNSTRGNSEAVKWFLERNEGYGLDIILEMSGAASAIADAFRIVRNGGRITLFGIPSAAVALDVAENIIFKNLTVLGLNGRKIFETWYRTRWLLESGVVDLRPLITLDTGFDDIDQAMERLAKGQACKIVLRPGPGLTEMPAAETREETNSNVRGRVMHP